MKNKSKLFTIELNKKKETVEIHLDKSGAKELIDRLEAFIRNDESEHDHLMTEEWGGGELSSEKQNLSNDYVLINHLKLFYWKDK
ncbi:MAG TPA: Imm32 family immunity protein [Chitinophagaceae bacterium]|nr:Imm32 family immunity protein [Chitinophagaceae bacterium]